MTVVTLVMMFVYSPLLGSIACAAMLLYILGRWAWYWPLRHAVEAEIVHGAQQQSHFWRPCVASRPSSCSSGRKSAGPPGCRC